MVAKIIKHLFPPRTLIISTDLNTRFLKLSTLAQLAAFFIAICASITICTYNNKDNSSHLLSENLKLKTENLNKEKLIKEISGDLDAIHEYFNNKNGETVNIDDNKDKPLKDKMSSLHLKIEKRMQNLSTVLQKVGMTDEKAKKSNHFKTIFASKAQDISHIGGPYEKSSKLNSKTAILMPEKVSSDNIKYTLNTMLKAEKIVANMPIGSPLKQYKISSKYGHRTDPFKHSSAHHNGIDLYSAKNNIITSVKEGKVIQIGQNRSYGKYIIIEHGQSGLTTTYAHLNDIKVNKGDMIKSGTEIGYQGATGRAKGRHLHYEIRYNGNTLDPIKFINFQ